MKVPRIATALSLVGALSLASYTPAHSAPLTALSAVAKPAADQASVVQVRWVGWRGGWGPGWRGGWGPGWRRGGWGWGGLATGLLIGGALAAAASPPPYYYGGYYGGYAPYDDYDYGYASPAYGYGYPSYGYAAGYYPGYAYRPFYRRHWGYRPYWGHRFAWGPGW